MRKVVWCPAAIDPLPGPSEIMVLCDDKANPASISVDLLAQAEHGHDGEIVLVSPSSAIIAEVKNEMARQLVLLPRAGIIRDTLSRRTGLVEVSDLA